MQQLKNMIMTLVLLMTAAAGAWGMQVYISYPSWPTGTTGVNDNGYLVLEMEKSDSFENLKSKIEDRTGFELAYQHLYFNSAEMANTETLNQKGVENHSILTLEYTPLIAWNAETNEATIAKIPAGNVIVSVAYYPQATVATAPTAKSGITAGSTDEIVTEGAVTGGTMKYYASTSNTAPAYNAQGWTDDVPTANGFANASTVYVWYYPVGSDEGVNNATETFSDGDICATPLEVTLEPGAIVDGVTLTDGQGITELDPWKGQSCAVTYLRSFTSGTASTVCLPFAYAKKVTDGSFYAFTNIEKVGSDYVATMTEPGVSTLEANTPYLFMPAATGNVNFSGTYTIPTTLTAGSVTSNGWTFKGTYEAIEWTTAPTGTYGFSAQDANDGITQGQFVQVGAYVKIVPMRCYLENASFAGARGENRDDDVTLPETIKVRLVSANGEVTAIGTMQTKTGEVDIWYSLDGRRIQNPTKGVYVKNGRKVIVK